MRGGAFNTGDELRASYRSYFGSPSWEYYDIGFRVAQIPEPATLSLLVLGGLAMIRRQRN